MRRLISVLLALSLMCPLSGCRKGGLPQPDFPLEEAVVTAALEQTGLPGEISESDTFSNTEGYTSYMLRDQKDQKEKRMFTAVVSSALTEGERFLQIHFRSPSVSEPPPFAWEDWKQQLVFAALLFGGFSDEEEIYREFFAQEVPEGETPLTADGMRLDVYTTDIREWDAQLPAGYCKVRYYQSSTNVESSSRGRRILEQSPNMIIAIYESKAHYERLEQEIAERREEIDAGKKNAQ